MRVRRFVELTLLGALSSCAASHPSVGSSLGDAPQASPTGMDPLSGSAGAGGAADDEGAAKKGDAADVPAGPPPPDPALVRALVDKTGDTAKDVDVENPLHVRLEVIPRPAGELWLLAVVNRGTEPAQVQLDLARLNLVLEPPESPKPKKGPRPRTTICKLPEAFVKTMGDEQWRVLEPGEGLVQTFDPRLYCISPNGDSLLATGQRVTAKLGYAPKPPRVVWKNGQRTEVPSLQVPPFIAQPAAAQAEPDPEHDRRIKELVASKLVLTSELTASEAEEDPSQPLSLKLVRGSDAATEVNSTATVEIRARRKTLLYFRRELLSFTVHGPDGIRGCFPEPDNRAPDRTAYTPLGPGRSISATSLLAELCPKYTFARPGLYVVSARLDANRDGSEFGLSAFTGRLESPREALVRIRTGDFPALPPPEPLRVRVGQ